MEMYGKIKNYKPRPGERPKCAACDREKCGNREKFQRDKLEFSVTSGRCPRLPDKNGNYDKHWYDLED